MKEFNVVEVAQSVLEAELTRLTSEGWKIIKLHASETNIQTWWTVICEKEEIL